MERRAWGRVASRGVEWVVGSLLAVLCACAPAEEPPRTEGSGERRQAVEAAAIDPARELLITDVSAVDDPRYTTWAPGRTGAEPEGAWSFGRLIDNMVDERLRTPWGRSQFVLRWLRTWEREQEVNGHTVAARPRMRELITEPWRAASGCTGLDLLCELDFSRAPFRLLAIVYRPDLRRMPGAKSTGYAGQGRFVFGALGPQGQRLPFTVIFEYQLPASHRRDILSWAERWHALGRVPFGPEYNARLQELTHQFSRRGAAPSGRNGSALLQLRTNEVLLSPVEPKVWEMRQFVLGPRGFLELAPVENEPDASLDGSELLGRWVEKRSERILAGEHQVPRRYTGRPFLAGSALVPPDALPWRVPGAPEEVRRAFGVATCSGCHKAETGTDFLHVRNREPGKASVLSGFLLEEVGPTGRRFLDYQSLLNQGDPYAVQDGRGLDHGAVRLPGEAEGG
jgi:hypothetical protein